MTTINMVPEFTSDEGTTNQEAEEVKDAPVAEKEKETPAEPPAAEKPDLKVEDADALKAEKAALGLQSEILKLRKEITELRGQKRELKKEELIVAAKNVDELADVSPEDTKLIDRVLKARGYVTKEEQQSMYYKAVQDEELARFLEKYPEYKPENDPSDSNWSALQAELGLYKLPQNPHQVGTILERAHKAISKSVGDRGLPEKKKAVETASAGSGGSQRSSSGKKLDPVMRARYESGGWSEEEIKEIESRL